MTLQKDFKWFSYKANPQLFLIGKGNCFDNRRHELQLKHLNWSKKNRKANVTSISYIIFLSSLFFAKLWFLCGATAIYLFNQSFRRFWRSISKYSCNRDQKICRDTVAGLFLSNMIQVASLLVVVLPFLLLLLVHCLFVASGVRLREMGYKG